MYKYVDMILIPVPFFSMLVIAYKPQIVFLFCLRVFDGFPAMFLETAHIWAELHIFLLPGEPDML